MFSTPNRPALAFFLALCTMAEGQEPQTWSGIKVVPRYAQPIREGERVVDPGTTFRVYVVSQAVGDRLIVASGPVRGWIDRSAIVRFDEAEAFFSREIEGNPNDASAHNWRGMVLKEKGEFDRALADYDEAIRLDPGGAYPWNNRGNVWLAREDYDRALADYDRAIQLDPSYAQALGNRGLARQRKKDYELAFADYDRAIEIDPQNAFAFNERAWLWSTCPVDRYRDGDKAVLSATKACDLTAWKEPNFIDTLAAAYAEMGFFEQATRWQQKAISQAPAGSADRREFAARLDLYKKRLPYRQP